MKKYFFCILLLSGPVLFADIISPGMHVVDRNIYITNCDDYPEVILVGYYEDLTGDGPRAYVIRNDNEVSAGYKFNTLFVLALTQEEYEGITDLADVDFDKIINENSIEPFIDSYGGEVKDANPITEEEIDYKILEIEGSKVVLTLDKVIFQFDDGSAQTVNY